MRKITNIAVAAFFAARPLEQSNMEIEVLPNVTIMKLFGNSIAFRYNDPQNTLSITNCGFETNTTKERLNGVLSHIGHAGICQRKGIWYLGDDVWDGKLTDVAP